MAKGGSSNKAQPRRKMTAAQIVFIVISVLVLASMIFSAFAKF
jgi:hypothetical protein